MLSFSANSDSKQSGRGFGPQFQPTTVTTTTNRSIPINLGVVKAEVHWSRTTTTTYPPRR